MVSRTSNNHDTCCAACLANVCYGVKYMKIKTFNIYNVDVESFDTILEYINGGAPNAKKLEVAKEKFNLVRLRLQTKLNTEMENEKNRPNENLRLIPNPTSAEHRK